jgi:hypothetical protein
MREKRKRTEVAVPDSNKTRINTPDQVGLFFAKIAATFAPLTTATQPVCDCGSRRLEVSSWLAWFLLSVV